MKVVSLQGSSLRVSQQRRSRKLNVTQLKVYASQKASSEGKARYRRRLDTRIAARRWVFVELTASFSTTCSSVDGQSSPRRGHRETSLLVSKLFGVSGFLALSLPSH